MFWIVVHRFILSSARFKKVIPTRRTFDFTNLFIRHTFNLRFIDMAYHRRYPRNYPRLIDPLPPPYPRPFTDLPIKSTSCPAGLNNLSFLPNPPSRSHSCRSTFPFFYSNYPFVKRGFPSPVHPWRDIWSWSTSRPAYPWVYTPIPDGYRSINDGWDWEPESQDAVSPNESPLLLGHKDFFPW